MANSQEIVIPKNFGQLSKVFGNVKVDNELSAGIQASYAVVKYRGKVWSVNYRGEENPVLRADGDGQANSIEVVIVKSSPILGKTYYIDGWKPDSRDKPDCFSNDGLKPEASSPHLQNDYCKTCKHNQFGTGPNGRGKACADSKRLVVVPVDDLRNEAYGGPMLLRVPAASLQNMAAYGDKLKQLGYVPFGVATRVSFDTKVTHPQFVFGAIRALKDEEAEVVQELRNDERVDRILSLAHEDAQEQPVKELKPEDVFEQPPNVLPREHQDATKWASKSDVERAHAKAQPNTELKKELKEAKKEDGPKTPKPDQLQAQHKSPRKIVGESAAVAKEVEEEVEDTSARGLHAANGSGEGAQGADENGAESSPLDEDLDAALSKLI
jgi:hypothetical protein